MTNNNDRIDPAALRASQDRRLAELRNITTIMPDRPTRKLPPRSRRNSVPHRDIR